MAESRHEIVSLLSDKLVSKQPYEGLLKGLNKDTLHTAVHAEFGP